MIGDDDWRLTRRESARRHQLDLAYQALMATISAAKALAMAIDDLQGNDWKNQPDSICRIDRKLSTARWWIDEARRTVKGEDA